MRRHRRRQHRPGGDPLTTPSGQAGHEEDATNPTTHPPARAARLAPPSLAALPWLLIRFVPHYLRHLLWQPYRDAAIRGRQGGAVSGARRRHYIAMYDAALAIMLSGYAELTGQRLHPRSGPVAVRLMLLGFAFDDEFERRSAAGRELGFDAVFGSPAVRECLAEWRGYMGQFETYPAIRDYLLAFVPMLYRDYVVADKDANEGTDFDSLLRNAIMDSGGLLVALSEVIGRLHGRPPGPEVTRQFSSLGLSAKLADDMVDFRADVRDGRANLLALLARQHPAEAARVENALSAGRRMSAGWWRRNCPAVYGCLVDVYAEQEQSLTGPSLRYASRLMWTPALVGLARASDMRGRV